MILTLLTFQTKHLKFCKFAKAFGETDSGLFPGVAYVLFCKARRVNVLRGNFCIEMQRFRYEVDGILSGKLACPADQADECQETSL